MEEPEEWASGSTVEQELMKQLKFLPRIIVTITIKVKIVTVARR